MMLFIRVVLLLNIFIATQSLAGLHEDLDVFLKCYGCELVNRNPLFIHSSVDHEGSAFCSRCKGKTGQLIPIQSPDMNGYEGIDYCLGSFSYIKSEELIEVLKKMVVEDVMVKLRQWSARANQFESTSGVTQAMVASKGERGDDVNE